MFLATRFKSFGLTALLVLSAIGVARAAPPAAAGAPASWQEGKNYFAVIPAQRTNLPPGKVEVTEVFSYGCPYCNTFSGFFDQLKASLPANVQFDYLPAAFNTVEDWPMFQRAFCTAQLLGVAEKAHDGIFSAVWKTGELAVMVPGTNQLKKPSPTIEDAARVYNKLTGVAVDKFIATSKSFAADVKIKSYEALIRAYHVDQTPTVIVNGKYRITFGSAGSPNDMIALVKWLVAKETT